MLREHRCDKTDHATEDCPYFSGRGSTAILVIGAATATATSRSRRSSRGASKSSRREKEDRGDKNDEERGLSLWVRQKYKAHEGRPQTASGGCCARLLR